MERVPIERILCPIDFSEFSVRAYDYALALAQHYKARLIAQHVVELWKHPSACFAAEAKQYMSFCERIVATVTEQLRIFVGDHTPNGIYPECVTQEGMATECILSCAQQRAVNLIVIGTYGCRGFDRLTLGSVTDKVIQKARCPVLAVHKSSRELAAPTLAEHPVELREVVFCTNFSKESSGVLDYALSVAAEYKAKLTLVHVLEGISKLRLQDSTAKAYQCFDRLVPEQIRLDQGIATAVRAGSAYKEISQLASVKHADLVVMAVRDHKGLEDVFSATSYRVARSGECPVLAVYR